MIWPAHLFPLSVRRRFASSATGISLTYLKLTSGVSRCTGLRRQQTTLLQSQWYTGVWSCENMGRNSRMVKAIKKAYQAWRSFQLNIWAIPGLIHI